MPPKSSSSSGAAVWVGTISRSSVWPSPCSPSGVGVSCCSSIGPPRLRRNAGGLRRRGIVLRGVSRRPCRPYASGTADRHLSLALRLLWSHSGVVRDGARRVVAGAASPLPHLRSGGAGALHGAGVGHRRTVRGDGLALRPALGAR